MFRPIRTAIIGLRTRIRFLSGMELFCFRLVGTKRGWLAVKLRVVHFVHTFYVCVPRGCCDRHCLPYTTLSRSLANGLPLRSLWGGHRIFILLCINRTLQNGRSLDAGSFHYRFCGGQSGTGIRFSPSTPVSPCQGHSPNTPHSSSSICCLFQKDKRTKSGNLQTKQCSSVKRGASGSEVTLLPTGRIIWRSLAVSEGEAHQQCCRGFIKRRMKSV